MEQKNIMEKNEHLQELLETLGPQAVGEIIEIYLQQTPRILEEIRHHLAQENYMSISKAAHKLKSSSLSLGATEVGNICLALEGSSEGPNSTSLPAKDVIQGLCQRLFSEYEKVKIQFHSFLSR